MNGTRWVRADFDPKTLPWPEPPKDGRIRTTVGLDREIELVEFEVPRLPSESGWYRHPKTFGAVFLRSDGTWLDANGNRVDEESIPDGLIRLIDAPTEGAARG